MGSQARGETTLYIVCYDIPDDRRRGKVHAALSGYGAWTQYSLFECFLTKKELVQLRARLAEIIHHRQDSVRLYTLCDGCKGKVEILGTGEPPSEPETYIL